MSQTILLVEDDADIRELVEYNLERSGFRVVSDHDGGNAFEKACDLNPDLILLDIMLPASSGLKICQRLREHSSLKYTPIIMLSAKGEETDIVTGLELGADDYVTKPFSPNELMARIKSALRRSQLTGSQDTTHLIELGPISIDTDRHEIKVNGKFINFTLAEFNLLKALISKPGRVFTRDQLLEKIAGSDTYLIDRNVDVHIRAVRKKLGEELDLIETIRGVGYKWKD